MSVCMCECGCECVFVCICLMLWYLKQVNDKPLHGLSLLPLPPSPVDQTTALLAGSCPSVSRQLSALGSVLRDSSWLPARTTRH